MIYNWNSESKCGDIMLFVWRNYQVYWPHICTLWHGLSTLLGRWFCFLDPVNPCLIKFALLVTFVLTNMSSPSDSIPLELSNSYSIQVRFIWEKIANISSISCWEKSKWRRERKWCVHGCRRSQNINTILYHYELLNILYFAEQILILLNDGNASPGILLTESIKCWCEAIFCWNKLKVALESYSVCKLRWWRGTRDLEICTNTCMHADHDTCCEQLLYFLGLHTEYRYRVP